ncbi:hypothetical protein [uncultured Desulfosarcina sp.]|uniref:hypothetical protein n=1 Tax=uncultured Desulfosarcina sp. TaxID=218289 RepID=UPI0029C74971|nr:hypothetical protein [uncultured Desulfosarcina sp.]
MNRTTSGSAATILVSFLLLFAAGAGWSFAGEKSGDICRQVTAEQLSKLYRKPLYPSEHGNGCMWSKKPGGMAYLDINVHEYQKDIRQYFNKEMPSHIKLEKITDLGDDGLMTVVEGCLGVIVVKKGDRVMQSAVTFLEIEPKSDKQKVLWDIYRNVLKRLK